MVSEICNFTSKNEVFFKILTPLPLFENVIPAMQEASISCYIIRIIIFHFTNGEGYRSIFAHFCSTIITALYMAENVVYGFSRFLIASLKPTIINIRLRTGLLESCPIFSTMTHIHSCT